MTAPRDIVVIIVNWNGRDFLRGCLESLPTPRAAVIVDNGSTDDSATLVASEYPDVTFIANGRNLGFSAANNVGTAATTAPYLLFLNNDTVVGPGALERMRAVFDRDPSIGIVGGHLHQPDGRSQIGSIGAPPTFQRELRRTFRWRGEWAAPVDTFDYSRSQLCTAVCGAALMIRRNILKQVGGWPEEYFAYAEDADLCQRVRAAGYGVWYESTARILHFHGGSGKHRGILMALRSQVIGHHSVNRYIRRHEGRVPALLHAALFPLGLAMTVLRRLTGRLRRSGDAADG